ncbi:MAG TPA: hypothetical protein VFQ25_06450 [Ktedonobacterales bacterium]|nr:hypothetical protein [Ktedonobacterales bacterium]
MEYSEDERDRIQSEELDDELSQAPGSNRFRDLERDLEREDEFARGPMEQARDKPGGEGPMEQARDKPGSLGPMEQAHDKPGSLGPMEQARDRAGSQGPMEEAEDRPGAFGPMEQARDDVERALREDDTWPPSGRDPRTLRDARPLNDVRQEDRGVGPLEQDNESDAPYDPYEH